MLDEERQYFNTLYSYNYNDLIYERVTNYVYDNIKRKIQS